MFKITIMLYRGLSIVIISYHGASGEYYLKNIIVDYCSWYCNNDY